MSLPNLTDLASNWNKAEWMQSVFSEHTLHLWETTGCQSQTDTLHPSLPTVRIPGFGKTLNRKVEGSGFQDEAHQAKRGHLASHGKLTKHYPENGPSSKTIYIITQTKGK